jgi:glycosyltransferase involved in cell wall biosynthesis
MRQMKMVKARLERTVALHEIDAVIAPSAPLAEGLRAAGFSDVHLVRHFAYPGPEPSSAPSANEDVVYAGGLTPEKGILELVEAFAAISATFPESRLIVAGEGPLRARLGRLAESRVPGRIRFLGLLDESAVRHLMGTSRVVVAPSLAREAAGLTVLEAALAGRPVVTSDDPAIRELVDEADCGIVTPRGDVEALAVALAAILADPALSDRLGGAGRRVASTTRSTDVGIAATRSVYVAARRAARKRMTFAAEYRSAGSTGTDS